MMITTSLKSRISYIHTLKVYISLQHPLGITKMLPTYRVTIKKI